MKLFNFNKIIPFLITLIIVFILNINNQKEYTKLKILIWNTPTLSLGTYLTISIGTGFILSYLLNINLEKIYLYNREIETKYKNDFQNEKPYSSQDNNFENQYDNTLIERDIKEPSPTINASFRVIGKSIKNKYSQYNNYPNEYGIEDLSVESEYQEYRQDINYKNEKKDNPILNDWDDDTYISW